MARLIAQTGHTIDLPPQGVTFGADAANGVVIPAYYGLAPSHFAIWEQPDGYYVRDSGSGLGLWINGQPVREHRLGNGDVIGAGQLQLQFEHLPPPPPPAAPEAAVVQAAEPKFEVLPPALLTEELPPPVAPAPAVAEVPIPPAWLALDAAESLPTVPSGQPPQQEKRVSHRKAGSAHRQEKLPRRLFSYVKYGLLSLIAVGCMTAGQWSQKLGINLTNGLTGVFVNKSAYVEATAAEASAATTAEAQKLRDQQRDEVRNTALDVTRPHAEVVPRFIWKAATSLFSLGFPEMEIFYINEAQRKGLPLPKRHCIYLEKHFGLKIADLERLTSIQAEPTKPGIVVFTTQKRETVAEWLKASDATDEGAEAVGPIQIIRYQTSDGRHGAISALDDRNYAIGDPVLIKACLQRKMDLNSPLLAALWPDFMRKQIGSFAWTIKVDEELASQLTQSSPPELKKPNFTPVTSFAVRFGGEPLTCECFAVRDPKSTPESFTDAANSCLKSMTQMIVSHAEAPGQPKLTEKDLPQVRVARTAAAITVPRGESFVSIFLQGYYQPPTAEEGPLKALAQARTLAHAFNCARKLDAPEARRVHTVEEALAALQRGMNGMVKNTNMDFQIPEMDAEELRAIRKYLTFIDDYLACRPDLDSLPPNARSLAEEGRNRLNAETVLSLGLSPKGDRVVKIPDLATYLQRALTNLKANPDRGAMALFGMPILNDEELKGVLRYIGQQSNGKLAWKSGEVAFNVWQAKINPKALRDASTLASIAGAAQAAGATELLTAASVSDAIQILAQGIRGAGQFNSTTFRCKDLTTSDMENAANLLELEHGLLRLKEVAEAK